ncbi:hypothetical protein [Desulfitobacterium sp. AusDCA]
MKPDCEIACDATALAAVKPAEHKQYARNSGLYQQIQYKENSYDYFF